LFLIIIKGGFTLQFDDKLGSIQQMLTATNVGILSRQAFFKRIRYEKELNNY